MTLHEFFVLLLGLEVRHTTHRYRKPIPTGPHLSTVQLERLTDHYRQSESLEFQRSHFH